MIELVKLLGIIDLDVSTTGAMTLKIYSDLPGNSQVVREILQVNAVPGRQVVRLKLQGTTKGHAFVFEITGGFTMRLFGAKVYAKTLGNAESKWTWYAIDGITPTPEEWASFSLPITPTAEEWASFPLPITPTSEDWASSPLPITPTSEEWAAFPLPITPTSEEWTAAALPIQPTPDDWTPFPLPIEPTPDIRVWVPLAVNP